MITVFLFFNDTATTEIYTLSLHDALPIFGLQHRGLQRVQPAVVADLVVEVLLGPAVHAQPLEPDRKSTRLNSSHANISYAVFCLKKKTRGDSVLSTSLHQRRLQLARLHHE